MPTVLAFDVNKTLLDLRALDPVFEEVLGDASLRPQWFASMLQISFVGALTGEHVDFTTAHVPPCRCSLHGRNATSPPKGSIASSRACAGSPPTPKCPTRWRASRRAVCGWSP